MANDLVVINPPPRLLHYSQKPMLKRQLATAIQQHPYGDMTGAKPRGLWLSVEGPDDWKTWCESERYNLENLRHAHEIILKPSADILWIKTVEELDAFDAKHRAAKTAHAILEATGDPVMTRLLVSALRSRLSPDYFGIDWRRVSTDYQGIIIAPYQWERRLSRMMWYYTWDCASGCIWGADAIAEIKLLKEKPVSESDIRRNIHGRQRYTRRKMKKTMKKMNAYREHRKTWKAKV